MAEITECIIVELLSIVKHEDSRDSETADDVFLEEASNIFLCDSGQWFSLDLFGDVVDPYGKKLELPYGNEEGSYYVQGDWANG